MIARTIDLWCLSAEVKQEDAFEVMYLNALYMQTSRMDEDRNV